MQGSFRPEGRAAGALVLTMGVVACTPVGPRDTEPTPMPIHDDEPPRTDDIVEPPADRVTEDDPVPVPWPCTRAPVDHPLPFAPFDADMADVDGDGDADLVALGWMGRGMVTVANDGTGGFVETARPSSEDDALQIVLGDVDGDGRVDLLTFHPRLREVHVRRGDGRGEFAPGEVVSLGRQVYSGLPHDFDGDGAVDLVVTHFRHVAILLGDGRGGFRPRPLVRAGQAPSYPLVADFDGDGGSELALASNDDGGIDVFSIGRKGALTRRRHTACGHGPIALVTGDFTGDGRSDLATANMHSGDVCVFAGTDKGFVEAQRIDQRSEQLAALDFDRDGRDELVLIGTDGLFVYGSSPVGGERPHHGALSKVAHITAGHAPRRAFTRDLDGDGLTDLLLVNGNRPSWRGEGELVNPSHATFTVLLGAACTLAPAADSAD